MRGERGFASVFGAGLVCIYGASLRNTHCDRERCRRRRGRKPLLSWPHHAARVLGRGGRSEQLRGKRVRVRRRRRRRRRMERIEWRGGKRRGRRYEHAGRGSRGGKRRRMGEILRWPGRKRRPREQILRKRGFDPGRFGAGSCGRGRGGRRRLLIRCCGSRRLRHHHLDRCARTLLLRHV